MITSIADNNPKYHQLWILLYLQDSQRQKKPCFLFPNILSPNIIYEYYCKMLFEMI